MGERRTFGAVTASLCALIALPWLGACEPPAAEEPMEGADKAPAGIIDANGVESPLWETNGGASHLTTEEGVLELLNAARDGLRMQSVTIDPTLNESAVNHAEYLALHLADFQAGAKGGAGSIHKQVEGSEGFTGVGFAQRATAFGYEGNCFAEVVAFKPTAVGATRSWLESLYHRVPLLEPTAMHIGYGEAEADGVMVNVLEVGRYE